MMSVKKKILLFTDWYEPGYKAGGPIQSCKNIVSTMAGQFSFYIFTSDRDLGEEVQYKNISTNCWIRLSENALVWYASPEKLKIPDIIRILKDINPDVVYLNSMYSKRFTLIPIVALKKINFDKRIILAPRGMLHHGAMAQKKWKKKLFLLLFSLLGLEKDIIFHATDEQERALIQKHLKRNKGIRVAENLPTFNPSGFKKRHKLPGQLKCVYISRIHPHKNLYFILQALQNCELRCSIKLDIYGVIDDDRYYNICLQFAGNMNKNVQIEFIGPIPHSKIFEILDESHLFILPTLGENFGHVIFESLSSGCPVLISDQTPWKGLKDHGAGWEVNIHNKKEYSKIISQVCNMDDQQFQSVSLGAYNYAKEFTKNGDVINQYMYLFQ